MKQTLCFFSAVRGSPINVEQQLVKNFERGTNGEIYQYQYGGNNGHLDDFRPSEGKRHAAAACCFWQGGVVAFMPFRAGGLGEFGKPFFFGHLGLSWRRKACAVSIP